MKNIEHILPILKQAGLIDKEITLYTKSLQMGSQRASALCKYTNINRNTAQYTCKQLVQKRLMTVCPEKNSFVFTAEPPEKLSTLLEEEKRVFENRSKNIGHAIEILKMIPKDGEQTPPQVKYFEGAEGVIDMFKDVLQTKSKIYGAFRMEPDMNKKVLQFINTTYITTRHKTENEARMIFNDNKATRDYQSKDQYMNRISLLLPTEKYPLNICYHIYGDKIAFYTFTKEEQSGIIIQNKFIRDNQLSLFTLAWDQAKTLYINKAYQDIIL